MLKLGTFTVALLGLGLLSVSLVEIAPFPGTRITACFDNLGGLGSRDPVMVNGLAIGRVGRVHISENFDPCAQLVITTELELPEDTTALILAEGVLGDRYVDLQPGGSDVMLEDGDEITYTQGAMILEHLVGRAVTSSHQEAR